MFLEKSGVRELYEHHFPARASTIRVNTSGNNSLICRGPMSKDEPRFSRPGTTHPLGKCSEARLDIPMPEVLRDKIVALATLEGRTPSEWARDALEKLAEGELIFMRRRMNRTGDDGDGMKIP